MKTTEEGGHHGISFLILERDMPGYEVVSKLEKMGWHASDTGELSFTDVEVPAENLLGKEDGGFYLIMANFQWERLLMALGAVGAMKRLLEVAVAYASEREAFGRPIGQLPGDPPQDRRDVDQGRGRPGDDLQRPAPLPRRPRRDQGGNPGEALHPARRVEVADEVIQIHGGYGYMAEYGVERAYRDARLGPIGGGTDEVMKEILCKQIGL